MATVDQEWWKRKFGEGWLNTMQPPQSMMMVPPQSSLTPAAPQTKSRIDLRSLMSKIRMPDFKLPSMPPELPIDPAQYSGARNTASGLYNWALNNPMKLAPGLMGVEAGANAFDTIAQSAATARDWFRLPENQFWGTQPAANPGVTTPSQPSVEEPVRTNAGMQSSPRGSVNVHPNVIRAWQIGSRYTDNPNIIASAIGNMMHESGDPTLTRAGVGDSGTAHGFFQHRDERNARRLAFHAAHPEMDPLEADMAFAFTQELPTTESRAWRELQRAGSPEEGTAGWLHFERPRGYDPERFHPQSISGWADRAAKSRMVYDQLVNANLPPVPGPVQSYQQPLPPEIPMPPERGMPVGADYSEMLKWADQARPQPYDEAEGRLDTIMATLGGLAAGVAGVDPSRNPGALFAAAGAGSSRGLLESRAQEQRERELAEAQAAQYAMSRANLAGDIASAEAGVANQRLGTTFQNEMGRYNTGLQNVENRWMTEEANRRGQFEAQTGTRQNIHDYQTDMWRRGQPSVISSGQWGAIVQQGGQFIPIMMQNKDMELTAKQMGLPGVTVEYIARNGTQEQLYAAVINEAVKAGVAQQIPEFANVYEEAVEAAQQTLRPSMQFRGTADVSDDFNRHVAAHLMRHALQNPGWIEKARAMGVPGAELLRQ